MASDDDDDYLSDKFLLESAAASSTSKKSLTYTERRKQDLKQSEIRNAQNRRKSRRAREEEALEQGLTQSLFERAKAEEEELGAKNKAMSMMLRMGFKPGESLGRADNTKLETATPSPPPPSRLDSPQLGSSDEVTGNDEGEQRHRSTAPLAIDIWAGKKGVGLGKRAPSPETIQRASKAARIDEETKHETFRSRTREAFEERRVLGRLNAASRTLLTLDEKAGVEFNILSFNPQEPETLPSELLEALAPSYDGDDDNDNDNDNDNERPLVGLNAESRSERERLRKQMQRDALQPLETPSLGGDEATEVPKKDTLVPLSLSKDTIDDAREFLRLDPRERLKRVLHYLREKYDYCFWCGTQYGDKCDLDDNCPGEDEEAHD